MYIKFKLYLLLLLYVPAALAGDVVVGEKKAIAATCATSACHGGDGMSVVPGTPHLAGLGAKYMKKQLRDYRAVPSLRGGVMTGLVLSLREEDVDDVVAFFNSKPRVVKAASADDARLRLGASIYRGGIPHVEISACMGCHGPTGTGLPGSGYPSLAGQDITYTINQLKMFQSGERSNDKQSEMRLNVLRMTAKEIEAVAYYLQSLKPINVSPLK